MKIQLDMYQTIAVAVVVLMLGKFLRERVELLERFCIPAPVIGGVIFAIFTCICYVTGIAEFSFVTEPVTAPVAGGRQPSAAQLSASV